MSGPFDGRIDPRFPACGNRLKPASGLECHTVIVDHRERSRFRTHDSRVQNAERSVSQNGASPVRWHPLLDRGGVGGLRLRGPGLGQRPFGVNTRTPSSTAKHGRPDETRGQQSPRSERTALQASRYRRYLSANGRLGRRFHGRAGRRPIDFETPESDRVVSWSGGGDATCRTLHSPSGRRDYLRGRKTRGDGRSHRQPAVSR